MMKRWLFVIVALFVAVMSVHAVPAMRGIWKVLKLVDGTEIRAELRGDEHFHFWRSADGKRYVESGQDGVYKLIDENAFNSRARAVQARATMLESAKSKLPESVLVSDKTHRGLIILVDYPDTDENGNRTLRFSGDHTKEFYKWITNTKTSLMSSEEGQKLIDAGYGGSVFDYFYTQSNGKFNIQFDVVGPYTLSQKQEYYGHNYRKEAVPDDPNGAWSMIIEACYLAETDKEENVDFTKYDWDGDGIIDLVYVLYSGLGEAFGGDENSVWPQSGDIEYDNEKQTTVTVEGWGTYPIIFDGKKLIRYACSSEIEKDDITRELTGGAIGTICHEFSHCLGLMDHYVMNDPNKNDDSKAMYALRKWDIMDYGNYNGGGKIPAGYNSFEKAYLGWRDPIEVDEVGSVKVSGLRPYSENGHAYKVKNHANENEYYLIENRQKTGWDAALPGSGVLITHMDYDEEIYYKNMINDANDHLRFKVIPADNKDTRDTQEDDTYPYSRFFSIFKNDRLDDTSSPSNKVYHPNIDGSNNLGYSIKNISVSKDGLASFDIISKFEPKDMLEVTKLSIDNWNLYEGVIDGSYLKGSLTIRNNDIVRKKGDIKIWLVDQQTKKTKPQTIPVLIKAGKSETYDFSFKNLIIGHRYSMIALYSTEVAFFTSDPMLCSNGGSDETVDGNENLTRFEYWFDNNVNARIETRLNSKKALIKASIDASKLEDGIHQLNYRLVRNDGKYSSVSSSPFLKLTKEKKGLLEYWFDGNYASRSSVGLSDTEDEQLLALDLKDANAFPIGYHILNMRAALPGTAKSPIHSVGVLKLATGKANTLEYWFNDDIKNSHRVEGETVADGYLFTSKIDMSSLPDGVHRLYYRAVENKSSLGSAVSVMPVIKVKQGAGYRLEYWFDEASDDRKTLDGSPSDDGESYVFTGSLSLTDLLIGEHTLYYRISADDGRSYSSVFSDNVILKFGPNADVNRDGKVNAADIVFVGNVLSKDDVGIDAMNRADADGSGEINKDDIQFIVRIIMASLD